MEKRDFEVKLTELRGLTNEWGNTWLNTSEMFVVIIPYRQPPSSYASFGYLGVLISQDQLILCGSVDPCEGCVQRRPPLGCGCCQAHCYRRGRVMQSRSGRIRPHFARMPLITLLNTSEMFVVIMPYRQPPSSYACAHFVFCCKTSSNHLLPRSLVSPLSSVNLTSKSLFSKHPHNSLNFFVRSSLQHCL